MNINFFALITTAFADTTMCLVVPVSCEESPDENLGFLPSEYGTLMCCYAEWISEKEFKSSGAKLSVVDEETAYMVQEWIDEHLGNVLQCRDDDEEW